MADEEEIEVTLDVVASGQVKVKMTRAKYEEVFPDDDSFVNMPLEDVPGIDMDDVMNMLNFECEDVWVDADLRGAMKSGTKEG